MKKLHQENLHQNLHQKIQDVQYKWKYIIMPAITQLASP